MDYQDDVLRFIENLRVLLTNKQGENVVSCSELFADLSQTTYECKPGYACF